MNIRPKPSPTIRFFDILMLITGFVAVLLLLAAVVDENVSEIQTNAAQQQKALIEDVYELQQQLDAAEQRVEELSQEVSK